MQSAAIAAGTIKGHRLLYCEALGKPPRRANNPPSPDDDREREVLELHSWRSPGQLQHMQAQIMAGANMDEP